MKQQRILVIGAGLAGSEAAYYIAKQGIPVTLYEMRPHPEALAHHTEWFAELVCSNSLKSSRLDNAAGLLKEEMRVLDSLTMQSAALNAVPAGQALAVDRDGFSSWITNRIKEIPNIEVIHEEVLRIPDDTIVVVSTGPLTSSGLANYLRTDLGIEQLYFYDAAAPIVMKDSIDFSVVYAKSRYDKAGGDDYLNCPFTKEQFDAFYRALLTAERVPLKSFEKEIHFEACMPIEAIAARGPKTLTFGPLKPVGLETPEGKRPYAVVQLRQDNLEGTMYNLVGFQTNLYFKEQERIFHMIPGLENARFLRYGVMHRNTYLNAPRYLDSALHLKTNPNIFFAGQMVGVEGYVESAACGILAGINAVRRYRELPLVLPPKETVLGALMRYLSTGSPQNFQPMNANYGVLASPLKDKMEISEVSLQSLRQWREEHGI